MSDTRRQKPRNPYRKESKPARKEWMSMYRTSVRCAMARMDFDAVTKPCRTSGWMTW